MKTKILIAVVAYCMVCVMVFNGCCKKKCNDVSNPDCENYDACYGKKETKADFWVYEKQGIYETISYLLPPDTFYKQNLDYIDTDTFKLYTWKQFNGLFEYEKTLRISFKSKNENAKNVKWFIGNNQVIEGKNAYLEFDTSQFGKYKVMMVITYDKNNACFPNEKGIDTAIKYIYLKKDTKPVYATVFSGFLASNPNEMFDIEIKYMPCSLKTFPFNFDICDSDSSYFIKGLPRQADRPVMQLGLLNTKNFRVGSCSFGNFVIDSFGTISNISAKGEFNKNNTLTITYVYQLDTIIIVDKYIGKIK